MYSKNLIKKELEFTPTFGTHLFMIRFINNNIWNFVDKYCFALEIKGFLKKVTLYI